MPTGIGPDSHRFTNGKIDANDARYLHRPETSESVFYLWRTTKDPKYREWGWKIFKVYTYIHTYIHTCIHAYIHAYIHTFIHSRRSRRIVAWRQAHTHNQSKHELNLHH